MSISKEGQDNIRRFARKQAAEHLNQVELSYFEKLSKKTGQTKDKIKKKMAKFKLTSEETVEAQQDLELFMSDYVMDLMTQGISEDEAIRKAKEAMASDSDSWEARIIEDKYMNYYLTRDPQDEEMIGLYYGGFVILGLVIGIVVGFVLHRTVFEANMAVVVGASAFVGVLLGTAMGMLKHASLTGRSKQ